MTSFIGIILPTLFEIIIMKTNLLSTLSVLILSLVIISCGEDDPEPLPSEVQAVLLAGERGSSKNWKLTGITVKEGTDPEESFGFDDCFLDNIYTFKNNDSQDYEATEGATKCDSIDPNIIEAGTWAFTADGKVIIILPSKLTSSFNILFTILTYPASVVELTDTSLKTRMTLEDSGQTVVYNLTFVKN